MSSPRPLILLHRAALTFLSSAGLLSRGIEHFRFIPAYIYCIYLKLNRLALTTFYFPLPFRRNHIQERSIRLIRILLPLRPN